MPGGRPRKAAAIKELEGNRGRREVQPEIALHGTPDLPDWLAGDRARDHFRFLAAEFGGAGVLKRADSPALAMLADLWECYWLASEAKDIDAMCKLKQRWDSAASKLGLSPIDRSRLITARPQKTDEIDDKFFKITG